MKFKAGDKVVYGSGFQWSGFVYRTFKNTPNKLYIIGNNTGEWRVSGFYFQGWPISIDDVYLDTLEDLL